MTDQASAPPSKWNDLGIRVLSAAVLIPVVIAAVWVGGVWFQVFVALLGVLMALEWVTIVHRGEPSQFALHAAAAIVGAFLPLDAGLLAAFVSIAALSAISIALAARSGESVWRFLGVPYVSLPAIALVLLRHDPDYGVTAILWIFVTVWLADTVAYFAGRIIGGPKLAPRISPKKTWAGLGGAMAGSGLGAAVVAAVAGLPGIVTLVVVAAMLAVVEQAGDLFKSAMKRHFGVKDSGRLIPGHGGVIDRVDGLIAVASAAALIGGLRAGATSAGAGFLLW
jgi:phosphatidate cytidylyltransferase